MSNFADKLNNMAMDADLNMIKIVLAECKKTSKWLAEQLQVNPTTVSKWCTNTTQPDLYTLKKVSTLLKVDMRKLLNGN